MSLDIGPATVRLFKNHLSRARTIVWNGPVGLYEHDTYERHTNELARHIVSLDCTKIAGGGDSITVINRLGIRKGFDHVSTGGGALLKYLQDGTLPALTATYKRVLT